MINYFIEKLMNKLNTIMTVYYEEAPTSATFPYGVVPSVSITPLDYGYQLFFDVELYNNELSDSDVEQLCDTLRNGLDGYAYRDTNIGFYIGFESQFMTKQNEQDITYRRISFIARIF